MVLTLQQLLLRIVPTKQIINANMAHLLGDKNRIINDFIKHSPQPIDEYFLSVILDTGNTSLYWFQIFIHRHIHHLPLNVAMLACWQEYYTNCHSLCVFAMRTEWDKVVLFVYTFNYKENPYQTITDNLLNKKKSFKWLEEDWDFIHNHLEFQRFFYISSPISTT